MKIYLLFITSLTFGIQAFSQVTTISFSLPQTSAASSLYTNDGETMTVGQTIANSFECSANSTYLVPALHASTSYFTSTAYTFEPGYSYSIEVTGSGTASGNLANPSAATIYWGLSTGAAAVTTTSLSAACNAFPDGYAISGYLNSITVSRPNVSPEINSTVDLVSNFLTGITAVGPFANTGTSTNSTGVSAPFKVTTATNGFNIEAFPVAGDVPVTSNNNYCGGPSNPGGLTATSTGMTVTSVSITANPLITPIVNYVCSSQTYSIPGNTAPTWTISPAGYFTLSPNGTSVTVTKVSGTEGNVVLTATLPGTSISNSIAISSLPITNTTSTMSGSCENGYQAWLLAATPNSPTATNWKWTVTLDNGGYFLTSTTSPNTTAEIDGRLELDVTYDDACGVQSQEGSVVIFSNCNEPESVHFDASPNPAGSSVTITPHKQVVRPAIPAPGFSATPASIMEIKIFDLQGRIRSDVKYGTGVTQQQLDVSKLENGIYFILIYTGDKPGQPERKKILVQH